MVTSERPASVHGCRGCFENLEQALHSINRATVALTLIRAPVPCHRAALSLGANFQLGILSWVTTRSEPCHGHCQLFNAAAARRCVYRRKYRFKR